MKANEFEDKVRETFLKYFPNGYIRLSKNTLGGGLHISCGLIANIDDVTANIRHNDPLSISIFIHDNYLFNDTERELDMLVMEFDHSHVSVIPDNPHMYCQSHKIPFRKISANANKALLNLDKYFSRAKDIVTEMAAANRIIKQDSIDSKYL